MNRLVAGLLLALSLCASAEPSLPQRQWHPGNRQRLEKLIADYGRASPNYNRARPPYAVFDWDNTCIFLDMEEAALAYQLRTLSFRMTPEQLDRVVRQGVAPGSRLGKGQVTVDHLAADITASYAWLHQHRLDLAEVQGSPHYLNFITKMRFLYHALEETYPSEVCFAWVIRLFAGMTEAEVRQLAAATVEWQLTEPIGKIRWSSPASLPGQSGVVSVEWSNGLRLVPEMQDLFQALRDHGIDVWVCSASFVDLIREVSSSSRFGYNNPPERVLALELERGPDGSIGTELQGELTYGEGKTRAIRRLLVGRYGYGPLLVGGDSRGDENMMQDFPETQLVLIFNLLRDPASGIGKLSRKAVEEDGRGRYLLQGRDDRTGQLVPSRLHHSSDHPEGLLFP